MKSLENGETGTNLNTLRQALAGNLAAFKNAGGGTAQGGATKTATPVSKDKINANAKQTKDTKTEDTKNIINQQVTLPDDMKINLDAMNEELKRGKDSANSKAEQIIDMDDPEAGTSDESDDESDYEDIDEVCDSCLVEKLENMTCGGGIGIGTGIDPPLTMIETTVSLEDCFIRGRA